MMTGTGFIGEPPAMGDQLAPLPYFVYSDATCVDTLGGNAGDCRWSFWARAAFDVCGTGFAIPAGAPET